MSEKPTPVQRRDMHEWQRIYGTEFEPVHAWPENGPDGPIWQFHPVELND